MKPKITWLLILLVTHLVAFVVGSEVEKRFAFKYFAEQTRSADAKVAFGHYVNYRNIAVGIKEAKYQEALCQAELTASSFLDDLRTCISNVTCRAALENEPKQIAPELFAGSSLPFTYIEAKNGVRKCNG